MLTQCECRFDEDDNPVKECAHHKAMRESSLAARWERLCRAGLTLIVSCGPTGRWNVQVIQLSGIRFASTDNDLPHCLDIAEAEARRRGWVE